MRAAVAVSRLGRQARARHRAYSHIAAVHSERGDIYSQLNGTAIGVIFAALMIAIGIKLIVA